MFLCALPPPPLCLDVTLLPSSRSPILPSQTQGKEKQGGGKKNKDKKREAARLLVPASATNIARSVTIAVILAFPHDVEARIGKLIGTGKKHDLY